MQPDAPFLYRIKELIAQRENPRRLRSRIFKLFGYHRNNMYVKMNARVGDKNRFSQFEEQRIAEELKVSVSELFYDSSHSHSTPTSSSTSEDRTGKS